MLEHYRKVSGTKDKNRKKKKTKNLKGSQRKKKKIT